MYDLGPEFDGADVEPGTNILVSGPPLTGKRRLALQLLAHGADRGEGSVIVTTRDAADRVLPDYRSLVADPDSIDVGVVDCVTQHQGRSTADTDTVRYASSPEDMTGIGIKFSEFLEEFHSRLGLHRTRVLLDSVSTLLLYSDLQTVFRFLHVFTSRVESADAFGVYVIDATAHDAQDRNTLRQLFDGVIRTDEDSAVSVQLPGADAETSVTGQQSG